MDWGKRNASAYAARGPSTCAPGLGPGGNSWDSDLAVRVVWALVSAYLIALPPATASNHQRL